MKLKMETLIEASGGLTKLFEGKPFEDIDLVMAFVDLKKDFNNQADKFGAGAKAIRYKYDELLQKNGTLTVAERQERDKEIKDLNEKEIVITLPLVPFEVLEKRIKENAKKKELEKTDITMGDLTSFLEIGLTKRK